MSLESQTDKPSKDMASHVPTTTLTFSDRLTRTLLSFRWFNEKWHMLKNWSWKAILGGVAVDVIGSQILGVILAIPFGVILASHGTPAAQIALALTGSIPFLTLSVIIGLFMDALGGYAAATWAPTRKIAHSLVVGVLSLLSGLVFNTSNSITPLWFRLTLLLIIPAALLGGWWRVKTRGADSPIKSDGNDSPGSPPIASPF